MTTTTVGAKARRLWDVLERAAKTYFQVFVGLLLATNVFDINAVDRIGTLKALAISAIPAALSVVTSTISLQVGSHKTASALPEVLDPATPKEG